MACLCGLAGSTLTAPYVPPDSQEAAFYHALSAGIERLTHPDDRSMAIAVREPPNFRQYVRDAWHVVEPATLFVDGWHLHVMEEHLEAVTAGQIRRLIITIPPRHMKSLLVSVFWPTWMWTTWPWLRYLWASYAQPLATRDSIKCRRIIQSPWYQAHYGSSFMLTGDQNLKNRFENDRTGLRLATSVGGVGTGEGGDIVYVDDPHKVKQVESKVQRETVLDWWDGEMSTRLNDPERGAFVVLGQRTHHEDLQGHLLMTSEGWEHLNLPSEYDPKRSVVTCLGLKDPRTKPKQLLYPERFPATAIAEARRTMGSYRFEGQHNQNPSPPEGGILKRKWWRFYGGPDPRYRLPGSFDEVIQSWDMTFKDTTGSDYVCGQAWGRKGADAYLMPEEVHDRLDFPATIRAFIAFSKRYPKARIKLIEDKANGPAVISSLRRKIPGLIPVEPKGGKEARAHAVSYLSEAGNVYLPHPSICPWIDEFIEELAQFPTGPYDDRTDAATQALKRMSSKMDAAIKAMDTEASAPVHFS